MYLLLILLPALASLIVGILGRKIGKKGAQIITTSSIMISAIIAIIGLYEVGLKNSPISITIIKWLESESLIVNWGFIFDPLSISMCVVILSISALVHLYSIDYMSGDPHIQRFFSYLSLFTFFMLILVTSDNYLLMFIGWEGIFECLKWLDYSNLEYLSYERYESNENLLKRDSYLSITSFYNYFSSQKSHFPSILFKNHKRSFHHGKISSLERIGPHEENTLSIIFGLLLGDSQLEKRSTAATNRRKITNR